MFEWHAWTIEDFWWFFAFAIIILSIYLIIHYMRQKPSKQLPSSARKILKQRFARGEITKEEFQKAMHTLQEEE